MLQILSTVYADVGIIYTYDAKVNNVPILSKKT